MRGERKKRVLYKDLFIQTDTFPLRNFSDFIDKLKQDITSDPACFHSCSIGGTARGPVVRNKSESRQEIK